MFLFSQSRKIIHEKHQHQFFMIIADRKKAEDKHKAGFSERANSECEFSISDGNGMEMFSSFSSSFSHLASRLVAIGGRKAKKFSLLSLRLELVL